MPSWSDHPQSAEGWLWIMKPRRVFVARVNQATTSYPTAQITFDNVTTGAYTDLQVGMTVLIGTSEGAWDLGRSYVRADSTTYEDVATSTVLYIGYSSRGRRAGEVELLDNAYVTVLDLYEMWERPAKTNPYPNSVSMDYDLGSSGFMPPVLHVGNTGGLGTLGFVDGDDVLELTFDGSGAYTVSPDAPDWFTNSKEYDVGDGTITSGTSLDDAITVEFPPGYRWVTRTGFDEMGRGAIPRRFCVMALEETGENAPLATAYNIGWTRAVDGQVLTARLKERLDPADYPPGTVVMLLVKQRFNGVEDALGGWECKFAGWLDGIEGSSAAGRTDTERDTTIRAVDVAGRLKQMRRAPSRMARAASAAHPYEMESATLPRYLWWELVWHTWAPAFSDIALDLTNGDNYPFTQWSTSGNSCYALCDNLARAYGRRLTCDSRGRLQVIVDPLRQEEADRTATVQAAITEADWSTVERRQQPEPPVGSLKGTTALVSTTNAADVTTAAPEVDGIAPGRVRGRGSGEERLSVMSLARNPPEFYRRLGQDYARRNTHEHLLRLTLAHGADGGIEPALLQWVTVTISADAVDWLSETLSTERCLPSEVQFALDDAGGFLTQRVTVERETFGTIAEDDPRPVAPPPRVIIREPVLGPVPPVVNPIPIWGGVDQLPVAFYSADANGPHVGMSYSFDLGTGSFVWLDRSTGLSGNGIWDSANPWNYDEWFHLSDDGLYHLPSMESFTSWTQIADNDAIFGDPAQYGNQLLLSPYLEDWILIAGGNNAVAVSFDKGSSFTVVGVGGAAGGAGGPSASSIKVAVGEGVLYAVVGVPFSGDSIYESTDHGLSWSLVATDLQTDSNIITTYQPNVPYTRQDGSTLNIRDGSQQVYIAGGSGNRGGLNLSVNDGGTWSVEEFINAGGGAAHAMGCLAGWSLMSFTFLGDVVYFATQRGVGVTIDGGDNVTYYNSLMPSASDYSINLNGYALHSGLIIAWNRAGTFGYGKFTTNLGGTWVNINAPSFFTDVGGQRYFSNIQGDLSAFT
jgi:hypothetical protein